MLRAIRIIRGYLSNLERGRGKSIGDEKGEVRGARISFGMRGTFAEKGGSGTFVSGPVGVRERGTLKTRKNLGVRVAFLVGGGGSFILSFLFARGIKKEESLNEFKKVR